MNNTTSTHSKSTTDNYFKVTYQGSIDHLAFFNNGDEEGARDAFSRCNSRVKHLGMQSRMVIYRATPVKIGTAAKRNPVPWIELKLVGESNSTPETKKQPLVTKDDNVKSFKDAFDKKNAE